MSTPNERIEDAVVERLRARLPQLEGNVHPSTDLLSDVEHLVTQPPAALVQITSESDAPMEGDGDLRNPLGQSPLRSRSWFTVSVLFVAQDLRTREAGDRATIGMHAITHRSRASLKGFTPDGASRCLKWQRTESQGEDTERMLLLRRMDLTSFYWIEEAP